MRVTNFDCYVTILKIKIGIINIVTKFSSHVPKCYTTID